MSAVPAPLGARKTTKPQLFIVFYFRSFPYVLQIFLFFYLFMFRRFFLVAELHAQARRALAICPALAFAQFPFRTDSLRLWFYLGS